MPAANVKDLMLQSKYKDKIEIIPAATLGDVLDAALLAGPRKKSLVDRLAAVVVKKRDDPDVPSPERKDIVGVPHPQ